MTVTKEQVDEITGNLYVLYGTGSGCIFGLRPDQRDVVHAIVQCTLEEADER